MLIEIIHAANEIHPGLSPRSINRKLRFIKSIVNNREALITFSERMSAVDGGIEIALSPSKLGLFEWPYVNSEWDIATKLDAVATHYELLASMPATLNKTASLGSYTICDLDSLKSGAKIVIDTAPWFIREGELVLNLFVDDLRVASIAFLFSNDKHNINIIIGAIQGIHGGINSEDSLLIFKDLTKHFEGLRPRSLLIETIRIIANQLNISNILVISDENRHHRHKYFGQSGISKLSTIYNKIWLEHGGYPSNYSGFYQLPIEHQSKLITDIPSKKRAMYRRRNDIIKYIDDNIRTHLHNDFKN